MERKTNKADKGVPRMSIFSLVKVLVSQGVNLLEHTRLDVAKNLIATEHQLFRHKNFCVEK